MRNEHALEDRIKRVNRQLDDLRAQKRAVVIRQILAQLEKNGITLKDLKEARAGTKSQSKAAPGKRMVAPKYRHPDTGETWSGRGRAPRWLVAAELGGASRNDYLIPA
ncbi:H-NS histone family protein [Achromobacter sp.]|uniref:H-NS histone family protein n=1 Tax=Achromobacter sp. TaxID=134375 RepID=UPI0028AF6EF2|nr:H-NS histone family protein [Achromobacter sp.]